jgi:hypothetical protein
MNPVAKVTVLGLLIGVAIALVDAAAVYLAWQPWGPQTIGFVMVTTCASFIFWAAVLLAVPLCLLALPFRRVRLGGAMILSGGVAAIVSSVVPSLMLAGSIERAGIDRAVAAAEPLVRAISRYEDANGSAPPTLDALVPAFIGSIPGSGASAFPEFQYVKGQCRATRAVVVDTSHRRDHL